MVRRTRTIRSSSSRSVRLYLLFHAFPCQSECCVFSRIGVDRADELHGKHTLFGRCVGDTIYSVSFNASRSALYRQTYA